MKLDGTEQIKPVPFDAHEQSVRGSHAPTAVDSPDLDSANVQEYPKVVEHRKNHEGKQEAAVVAKDADHEKQLAEAKAEAEKE